MFAALKHEAWQALRSLLAAPGFLIVAVLTLALGIGSVSAVFSVVNGTLLKPLPYPQAGDIVRLDREQPPYGGPVSRQLLDEWRQGAGAVFSTLGAFAGTTLNLDTSEGAERLNAYQVTPEFWDALGLVPQLGRTFGAAEEASGERVVVLSQAFWRQHFAGDPAIVGRQIVLSGRAHTVVGVLPATFRYPGETDVYVPTWLPLSAADRSTSYLSVIGRLAPGADLAAANAAMARVNANLTDAYPDDYARMSARIRPLSDVLVSNVRDPLLVLLGASMLVLLIACANLANLLLARGSRRQRELAVRAALGASRGRLLRSVLVEAVMIAAIGGVAGILVALVAVPLILSSAPDLIPNHGASGVDLRVIAVSLGTSVLTVLAFAVLPALRASRVTPAGALKEEGRSVSGSRRRGRARAVLVAGEVALSLALLAGAGMLIESLRQIGRADTGVVTEGVLTAALVVPLPPAVDGEDFTAEYVRNTQVMSGRLDRVIERVAAIPGVLHVGLSDALPLSGMDNMSSTIELVGQESAEGGVAKAGAQWRFVNPDFFAALGMRVKSGRALDARDARPGEFPNAVMVNETFARRLGSTPIGSQIRFLGSEKTIVGVVSDSRLMGADQAPIAEVYMSHANAVQNQFLLAVKVQGEPMAYAESLRRSLRDLDPAMPVFRLRSMDDMAASGLELRAFNLRLMSVFSAVAVLLAVIGLYGVIAYSVAERRQEFGVRLSLGADGARLIGLVMRQGMGMVLAGIGVGLVGALALGRVLSSQLYGIGAADPVVLGSVAALLAGVAALACLVPALRAARVPPMEALRNE